mmetsp:Transcript_10195/g.14411  ORF Transcript_10195/g.14411 Transcript_10195/m.14411 type:complete len:411 (+) Transcript_10195:186-1418(+)|eukprot:CAMPEP_0184861804 /NCGR_PEP_ID=MMETSP0580-20130426/6411_1 /TAXON_ID=1118495 /ORGANISM="Dactyliosolen fragilissimus" /LENGTH=410 /DNA_ID=CAMNT_0027359443 /DNA_START=92 /DNA_END=1324 /DNA_ORIENTATION=-
MKSWADHSSDEESDDGHHPARGGNIDPLTLANMKPGPNEEDIISYDDNSANGHGMNSLRIGSNNDDGEDYPPPPPPLPSPENYPPNVPEYPPFTAHVRNLSYDIKTGEHLAKEIEGIVDSRYRGSEKVCVTDVRLGIDKETGKRKGFAYVEFGSREELMILLNLDDGYTIVCGRNLRVDVAQSRRGNRGSGPGERGNYRKDHSQIAVPNVDGSQFRGGKYARNTFSGRDNDGPPRQRPSLKLAPRTRSVNSVGDSNSTTAPNNRASGSRPNIFGGAKPREDNPTKKESKKNIVAPKKGTSNKTTKNETNENSKGQTISAKDNSKSNSHGHNSKRDHARGDRKLGKEDKYKGKGDRKKKNDRIISDNNRSNLKKDQVVPKSSLAIAAEARRNVAPTNVNSFAALGFDSDSD